MSIKTILVSLNQENRAHVVLRNACELASEHGAHLIGVHVVQGVDPAPMFGAYMVPDFVEEQQKLLNKRGDKMRQLFEDGVSEYSLSSEWAQVQSVNHITADDTILLSGQADLIVVSQADPTSTPLDAEFDFVDRLVMEAGRPVMIIPHTGEFKPVGHRAIIGWKATREAVRAVHDAVPVLAKSEKANLVMIDSQSEENSVKGDSAQQIVEMLKRHNVNVTKPAPVISDISVGEALLNEAAVHKADLIVVGA